MSVRGQKCPKLLAKPRDGPKQNGGKTEDGQLVNCAEQLHAMQPVGHSWALDMMHRLVWFGDRAGRTSKHFGALWRHN